METQAEQAVETPLPVTASSLISKFRPKSETFVIKMNGEVIVCRMVADSSDMLALERSAQKFATMVKTRPPEKLLPFKTAERDAIRMAFYVSELVCEPPFTQAEALELMRDCGSAGLQLFEKIEKTLLTVGAKLDEELDEAGEG